ncbi:MAG TPA: HPr family phosphocarrier protein [Pirellulales bacterium]|nr:HPr family phosphocarrier protein [Pirellulales bacterium]
MNDVKVSRTLVVNNPQGIHARPANLIVRLAQQYQSRIEFVKENQRVDGKSILDLLTLAAMQGTQLEIEATGPDAQQALDALAELFAGNFGEPEGQPQTAEESKNLNQ